MHVSPEVIVHLCLGTSLAVIIPPALSSALAHRRTGNVDGRIVFLMVIQGIAGSFLGSTLVAHLAHKTHPTRLRKIFAFLLLGTGVRMLF
jgi:uncharacterized membrane protein YfcA